LSPAQVIAEALGELDLRDWDREGPSLLS
jgi:hypothetical protein